MNYLEQEYQVKVAEAKAQGLTLWEFEQKKKLDKLEAIAIKWAKHHGIELRHKADGTLDTTLLPRKKKPAVGTLSKGRLVLAVEPHQEAHWDFDGGHDNCTVANGWDIIVAWAT